MKPLVSVVVATYNGEAFIEQTIRSILGQSYPRVELTVCDDGSSDRTREILGSFGENLQMVCQENAGVSAARNHGAQASQGEYIAFIDQDDVWEPSMLATLVPLLEEHPHWGLVYGDSWIVDSKGRRHGRRRYYLNYAEGWIFPKLLNGNFIPIETSLMRKSVFDAIGGFNETLRYLEDYELNLRLARECPVGFHAEPLARYRIHDSNLSHDIEALLHEWALVLEKLLKDSTDLTRAEQRMISREMHRRFGELAWQSVRRGDLELADTWLERAGTDCDAFLRWKVRVPCAILGSLPRPLAMGLLRLLPRRRLYGLSRRH